MAQNVFVQVAVMFIIMLIGLLCYKKKMISEEVGAQLSKFLLLVVNPCVILRAFQLEYEPSLAKGLLISVTLAAVSHFVSILVATVSIRKNKERREYIVERFAIVFSNCGFMAIPLIEAVLGSEGVFFASTYVAVFNIFTWTYGVSIMKGKMSKSDIIGVLKSAPIISIAVGLVIFFFSIKLPSIITQPINFIADVNTPLAMVVTGIYLARTNIIEAVKNPRIYLVTAMRLIVAPLIMIGIFLFFGAEGNVRTILLANLIASACPTAASTLMMSRMFGNNAEYASTIITVTTLLSIATIPVMIYILEMTMGSVPIFIF
ncbi:MAG: AEC family transporter [Ruminococcus sp.]|nr:AEC family transporter [Ruminococcus sp.]